MKERNRTKCNDQHAQLIYLYIEKYESMNSNYKTGIHKLY